MADTFDHFKFLFVQYLISEICLEIVEEDAHPFKSVLALHHFGTAGAQSGVLWIIVVLSDEIIDGSIAILITHSACCQFVHLMICV